MTARWLRHCTDGWEGQSVHLELPALKRQVGGQSLAIELEISLPLQSLKLGGELVGIATGVEEFIEQVAPSSNG